MAEQLAELDAIATDTTRPPLRMCWMLGAVRAAAGSGHDGLLTLKEADTTAALDAIEEEMSPKLAAHNDAIMLDRRLYDRLVSLDARARSVRSPSMNRAACCSARSCATTGARREPPEAEQTTLRELNERIATLEAKWNTVVVAGRNEAASTSRTRRSGRPRTEDLRAASEAATRRGLTGWVLDVVNTTGQPLLGKLANRDVRRCFTRPRSDGA